MPDFPKAYWAEWSDSIITRYSLREGPKGEWHGACPNCGHNDWPSTRFWIHQKDGLVKFQCRQCNDFQAIVQIMEEDNVWPLLEKKAPEIKLKQTAQDYFGNVVPMPKQEEPPVQFDPYTPYHERKGVDLIGAVLEGSDVVVPLFNTNREQVGHQRINPSGDKRFNPGLKKDGGVFGVVGKLDFQGKCFVSEGWATSVSVHMSTGADKTPVIFALDAGNLATVCQALQETWPEMQLTIAADNDANQKGQDAAKSTGLPWTAPAMPDTDWNDLHKSQGLQAVATGLKTLNRPESLLDELVWIGDAQPVLQSNYLIKSWLGAKQMTVVYGQSNTGKSFFTLDMSYHIAAGREWHGHKVKQGVVLYYAAEGGSGYLNRARAIQDHYGDENVPLAIRPCPINLLDPDADLPKLLAQIDMVKELHGHIALIVVDTLSRSMVGGNENSPEAMTAIISSGDFLRAHADCSIIFVHHSSKANDNAARGHSSLRAATDTEIELAVDEVNGLRFAKTTKQREIEGGREFAFELETVVLGEDEDGDKVTSCYVVPVTEERKQEAKVKLNATDKKMIECFIQLQGDNVGKVNPGGTGYPEGGTRWMIDVEELRKHYLGKTTAKNKSQAFTRPFENLVNKGQIAVNDGFCWLTARKYKL